MNELENTLFFLLLLLIPLLLSGFAWLKSFKYNSQEFRHLREFYLSIAVVAAATKFLVPLGPAYVVLSMLPWMWTLRTFGLLTGDISKQMFFTRLHLIVLALGGITSFIFLMFDFSLSMITAPFSLSISLTGITFILQSYFKGRGRNYSILQHFNLFLIFSFFISRLFFPVLVADENHAQIQILLDVFFLITFTSFIYPLFSEIVFEKHERYLEQVLQTRNQQLFSHSGFSEYKILAAGISHEINNALLIINGKIAALLRERSKDPKEDLNKIQTATNRIVRAIRGLREFIYPHEIEEILDLGDILKDVLELYGQRITNHDVKVNIISASGKLIRGRRIPLEQVFLSLINNSIDAMENLDNKEITISSLSTKDYVEITYQDKSHSRAEQIMPLLSNPFYASKELLDNDIRIVLAKEIVEKHGGIFKAVPGREFSTFSIVLPVSHAQKSTSMDYQTKIEELKELH
ncbi:MAG: sensor histidine kinase [Bacteriovoracia bacterium]